MGPIAIDARPLLDPGGEADAYTLNLVHSLAFCDQSTKFILMFDREPDPARLPRADNVCAAVVSAPHRVWKASALAPAAQQLGAKLLHVQGLLPAASPLPMVTTIRDLRPLEQPTRYPTVTCWAWRYLLPRGLSTPAAVLTPWECIAQQLRDRWPREAPRLHVVPYGVEPAFSPQCDSVHQGVASYFGVPRPYVLARGGELGVGPAEEVYRRAVEQHGLAAALLVDQPTDDPNAMLVPAGDDRVGPGLLSGSVAVLIAADDELAVRGAMEAAASGAPVIGPPSARLEELLGPAATLGPAEAQAAALAAVAADEASRVRRSEACLERMRGRTWPAMAEATLAVYQDVLSGG